MLSLVASASVTSLKRRQRVQRMHRPLLDLSQNVREVVAISANKNPLYPISIVPLVWERIIDHVSRLQQVNRQFHPHHFGRLGVDVNSQVLQRLDRHG